MAAPRCRGHGYPHADIPHTTTKGITIHIQHRGVHRLGNVVVVVVGIPFALNYALVIPFENNSSKKCAPLTCPPQPVGRILFNSAAADAYGDREMRCVYRVIVIACIIVRATTIYVYT